MQPSELTWPLKKKPLDLGVLLVRLQETLFSKTLWLDNLFPRTTIRVVAVVALLLPWKNEMNSAFTLF